MNVVPGIGMIIRTGIIGGETAVEAGIDLNTRDLEEEIGIATAVGVSAEVLIIAENAGDPDMMMIRIRVGLLLGGIKGVLGAG